MMVHSQPSCFIIVTASLVSYSRPSTSNVIFTTNPFMSYTYSQQIFKLPMQKSLFTFILVDISLKASSCLVYCLPAHHLCPLNSGNFIRLVLIIKQHEGTLTMKTLRAVRWSRWTFKPFHGSESFGHFLFKVYCVFHTSSQSS